MNHKQRFLSISGIFVCHKCNIEVYTMRYYKQNSECTWLCDNKHLSKVSLYSPRGY